MVRERSDRFVDESIAVIAKEKTVLDVGASSRFGKWLHKYEPLFAACNYRTFDASSSADIVGDIHAIPLLDASVDAAICSSVLEHVRDPFVAMREIARILKPGGKLFLFVPSVYPYHSHGAAYPDYWRFFEETVQEMLQGFSSVTIHSRGGYFLALSFFAPFQHKWRFILTPVADMLDAAFRTERRHTTVGYYAYAVK